MKILWVKSGPLLPADTGGKIRSLNMLRAMNREHEVTFLSLLPSSTSLHPDEATDPYATHKVWVPFVEHSRKSFSFYARLAVSLFSAKPFALTKHYSSALRRCLIELDSTGEFDLLICDFLASALHFVGHSWRTPTVLFQHNMEAQIWARMATNQHGLLQKWFFRLQHKRMARSEAQLSAVFNGVITVSPEDSTFAMEHYKDIHLLGDVPPGVDTNYFSLQHKPSVNPPILVFLGSMDWMPNVEGLLWFVSKIYPQVKKAMPGVVLRVVGRRPGREIRDLAVADPSIQVTGTVDDVRPSLRGATALIVPLLSGGGTRIKILEAMALGLPVISTTVGAEGLPFVDGVHLLLSDTAEAFSETCIRLINDPALASRLASAARHEVDTHYSWAAATQRFVGLSVPLCLTQNVNAEQSESEGEA